MTDRQELKTPSTLLASWIQLPASLANRNTTSKRRSEQDNLVIEADEPSPRQATGDDVVNSLSSEDKESSEEAAEGRVYLNADSEYHLSVVLILSCLLLLPGDSHIAAVSRRFILFLCLWMATGTLLFMTYVYYDSVFDNCFLSPQREVLAQAFRKIHAKEYAKFQSGEADNEYVSLVMQSLTFYCPFILAGVNILLLYFIVIRPKDVCQALSWEEGSGVGSGRDKCLQQEVSYPTRLYDNMMCRLSRLFSKKFWKFWWNHCVCRWSPFCSVGRNQRQSEKFSSLHPIAQILLMLLRLPFSIFSILFYTLPLFTFLHNVFTKPRQLLTCGLCQHCPCLVWITLPVTVLGVALLYWMLFDLTLLLSHASLFLLVDTLRNSETSLPVLVFCSSVLLYIRQAFADFEDGYRHMKSKIFELSSVVVSEAKTKGIELVVAKNQRIKLLQKDKEGGVSIPKHVFKALCKKYRPYRRQLSRTILKLLASLVAIAFLFAVTIQFHVFHQFSAVGETLFVAFTVSIPGLLGMLKSEEQKTLGRSEMEQKILATIRTMVKHSGDGRCHSGSVRQKQTNLNKDINSLPETMI